MSWLLAAFLAAAPEPIVGAIRWDAWHSDDSVVGQAVDRSLSPARWHYRLPFYAEVLGPAAVRIRANTPEVAAREIDYAADAGLDYFAFVTYDLDHPLADGQKLFLASPNRGRMRFCQIIEGGRLAPATLAAWTERFLGYFADPGYQRVLDGRPLLFLFQPAEMIRPGGYADQAAARAAIEALRQSCIDAGQGNPYLVAMAWSGQQGREFMTWLGADAAGAYAANGGGQRAPFAELAAFAEGRWEDQRRHGCQVVPLVSAGWDRRPRNETPVPWDPPRGTEDDYYEPPQPAELAAHLKRGVDWIRRYPESTPSRAILIYAWNENDEGGWLVPTLAEGTARLEAIRPVLEPAGEPPPEVWLCSQQSLGLADPALAWEFVRRRLDGVKLYIGQIHRARDDSEPLRRFVELCRDEGIALSIELGGCLEFAPLDATNGEESAEIELRMSEALRTVGGEPWALDLDGPVRRLLYPGDGKPGFGDLEACFTEVCDALLAWRQVHPELRFFALTNFPNWGWRGDVSYHARGPQRQDWGDYLPVLRGLIRRTRQAGVPLRGLTIDNPGDYALGTRPSATLADPKQVDWLARLVDLERTAEAEGLEVNLILNHEAGGNTSGEAFEQGTLAFLDAFRAAGGSPTRYLVQSWYEHPRELGPEDQPGTMLHLTAEVIRRVKAD